MCGEREVGDCIAVVAADLSAWESALICERNSLAATWCVLVAVVHVGDGADVVAVETRAAGAHEGILPRLKSRRAGEAIQPGVCRGSASI